MQESQKTKFKRIIDKFKNNKMSNLDGDVSSSSADSDGASSKLQRSPHMIVRQKIRKIRRVTNHLIKVDHLIERLKV